MRGLIVDREPLPDLGRASANDRIVICVVVWAPVEDIRSDDSFLEHLKVAGESLIDDVL